MLTPPPSQRWKDSDREDFLDDFGSDEAEGGGGIWTPPGQVGGGGWGEWGGEWGSCGVGEGDSGGPGEGNGVLRG